MPLLMWADDTVSTRCREVEVALGRPRTTEEYQEVLSSCLEECARPLPRRELGDRHMVACWNPL